MNFERYMNELKNIEYIDILLFNKKGEVVFYVTKNL